MKYALITPEGAADEAVSELDGRTPLQAAKLPVLDELARLARLGTAHVIPNGWRATSEAALLAVLGFDPTKHPAGRGAIEARAAGIELARGDHVLRGSLVNITDGILRSPDAGGIRSAEAEPLRAALQSVRPEEGLELHPQSGHSLLCVWRGAKSISGLETTPPHDLLDQPIRGHLPSGRGSRALTKWIDRSEEVLRDHDVNVVRRDLNEIPATHLWLWGNGPLPRLAPFRELFGISGAAVVDSNLARGMARLIRLPLVEAESRVVSVQEPATNAPPYVERSQAIGRAALEALDRADFVWVHVATADDAGHAGSPDGKVAALEALDQHVIGPVVERLRREREWRILVMPGHPTPVSKRRHTTDPTIFLLAGTKIESNRGERFDEPNAAEGEMRLERGSDLMEYFLRY